MKSCFVRPKRKLTLIILASLLVLTQAVPISALAIDSSVPITPVTPVTPVIPSLPLINTDYEYSAVSGGTAITKYKGAGGNVTIPSTLGGKPVVKIDTLAFNNRDTLTSVVVPDTVTSLSADAFSMCDNLKSVTLPDSITSIGLDCFYDCKSLTSIKIPSGLTTLELGTFNGCSSLTSITIPKALTTIKEDAFYNCSKLAEIKTASDNQTFASVDGILYSKDLTKLITYPAGKTAASFTIPSHVKTIGRGAFSTAKGLTSITIPASVTKIEAYAFSRCGLTSLNIPDTVLEIGDSAFSRNLELTAAVVGKGVKTLSGTFTECIKLKDITIGSSVTSIENYAFFGCSSLIGLKIPDSVTHIGNNAFKDCNALAGITIPANVTGIGDNAFDNCDNLASVSFGGKLQTIGKASFQSCYSLTKVSFPASLTSIGKDAFDFCKKITDFHFYGNRPAMDIDSFYYYEQGGDKVTNFILYFSNKASGWSTPYTLGMRAEPFNSLSILPLNPKLPVGPFTIDEKAPTLPFLPGSITLPDLTPIGEATTTTPAISTEEDLNVPPLPDGSTKIVLTLNETTFTANGQELVMDASPIMKDNRLLLPVRYVAIPLGASPEWNQQEQKVTVTLGSKKVELWIGNNLARVDGQSVMIDPDNPNVKPIIVPPGRTMLPLRFLGESLGCEVSWDPITKSATLLMN